jgi:hypothetical protein
MMRAPLVEITIVKANIQKLSGARKLDSTLGFWRPLMAKIVDL